FAHYDIRSGDLEAGFALADYVLEGTYRVCHHEQLYIENNGRIAVPREDGGAEVHGSLQCPYYIRNAMKRTLLPADRRAPAGRPGPRRGGVRVGRRGTPGRWPPTRRSCVRAPVCRSG